MEQEKDSLLLEAFRSGDAAAFGSIYRKYWYPMYRVVYRKTGRREIAEEIVQDIFTRLWRERKTLFVTDLNRYLFSAVRYETIDYYRSRILLDDFDEQLEDLNLREDTTTEETILFNDLLETIDKGLEDLPEKSKEIFRLSRFQHWPVSKIAAHFKLSEKAVEYHLSKALRYLRVYLSDTLILAIWLGLN